MIITAEVAAGSAHAGALGDDEESGAYNSVLRQSNTIFLFSRKNIR